ncbi:MAG TPA: hypothetical protein VF219_12385, partial [Vicinamibacterales bacterium]
GHSSSKEMRCVMTTMGLMPVTLLASLVLVAAVNISGHWEVESSFDDASLAGGGFDCAFKQAGDKLTGDCSEGTTPLTGEVQGQSVRWQMKAGKTQETITYTGVLDQAGTSMKGRFVIGDKGGRFTASKR